jgi:hypothetical protein
MKKEHDHETLADKFWGWWDYADLGEIVIGILLFLVAAFVVTGIAALITVMANLRTSEEEAPSPDEPAAHMARAMPDAAEAGGYLSAVCIAEEYHSIAEYTEGDGPAPEWYRPEEEMAAVWTADEGCNILATNLQSDSVDYNAHPPIGIDPGGVDWIADVADIYVGNKSARDTDVPCNTRQSDYNAIQRTDAGCPDWNVDSTLYGWDGHTAEAWEMDLFSRIFYLEFWQPDMTLCEAGCDAILRLWESEYYSPTLYGTLSAVTERGDYAFSTYGYVWDWNYDPDALAWCRAYCEERFYNGPVWTAPFFRKGCWHDWAVPCYQIGNIYFSTGKGWE